MLRLGRDAGRTSLPASAPLGPVSHYKSPPEKFPPADNLLAKIRPAGLIFTHELSAAGDSSGRRRSYNVESFYGAGRDILIKGRHIKSVIIFHA